MCFIPLFIPQSNAAGSIFMKDYCPLSLGCNTSH